MLEAVMWDMDGVIVDTEPIYDEYYRSVMREYGRELNDNEVEALRGTTTYDSWKLLKEKFNLSATTEELVERQRTEILDLMGKQILAPNPGVEILIDAAIKEGTKIAIATSGSLKKVRMLLKKIHLLDKFEVVIHGDSVEKGKPAPDIYLIAAERLNVPPENCVAIEDATYGVVSAKAAGMKVVGYQPPHNKQDLSAADLIIADLRALTIDKLKGLF